MCGSNLHELCSRGGAASTVSNNHAVVERRTNGLKLKSLALNSGLSCKLKSSPAQGTKWLLMFSFRFRCGGAVIRDISAVHFGGVRSVPVPPRRTVTLLLLSLPPSECGLVYLNTLSLPVPCSCRLLLLSMPQISEPLTGPRVSSQR